MKSFMQFYAELVRQAGWISQRRALRYYREYRREFRERQLENLEVAIGHRQRRPDRGAEYG